MRFCAGGCVVLKNQVFKRSNDKMTPVEAIMIVVVIVGVGVVVGSRCMV